MGKINTLCSKYESHLSKISFGSKAQKEAKKVQFSQFFIYYQHHLDQ